MKIDKEEEIKKKLLKAESKNTKYERLGKMKKRIKNSSSFTNVKTVGDDGLLYLINYSNLF